MRRRSSAVFLGWLLALATLSRAEVVLVKDGQPKAAIYVADGVMEQKAGKLSPDAVRLRESVNDLALYLEKISGARIEIVTGAPQADDKRLPILIGALATNKFGAPKPAPDHQGFRLTVARDAVGLGGESPVATSYAIYELLERLGCRWYMPSDLGEVVPSLKTISLANTDESLAPGTIYRGLWFADDAFKRRTRQGGLVLNAGHALEISRYIPDAEIKNHPEWFGLVNGKRILHRYCWGNPEVASMVADAIIKRLDASYVPTVSLSPDDGSDFCECDLCKKMDAGDMDPSLGYISLTDRFIKFANQIAERVTQKHPDVLFGWGAYGPTTRVPVREKMHPNLIPQIAPITYCRAHTFLQTECPSRSPLKSIVEGWGKTAPKVAYYNFMFHLSEIAVPYPMMKQMSDELPVLYANHVTFWQPETMPNFEEILPGMVLAMRMSWNPKLKPAAVFDEFFTNFYGVAAVPMRKYWQTIDDAWTTVPEHAGCGFGHSKRFTPVVLKAMRAAMDESLAAAKTAMEYRRVKLQDDSLRQFELFMKARNDLFEGKLVEAGTEATEWDLHHKTLGREYAAQYCFGPFGWKYFEVCFDKPLQDGARIAKNFKVISPSVRLWRYAVDKDKQGESLGWQKADFTDKDWKTTDPCVDTWFDLGLETYYGTVFYRQSVKLPAIPAGKKVYLWISNTDGTAKVFINGQPIPYVNEKGQTKDEFSGYCQPASFEITAAAKAGAENQITIVSNHPYMNELGTGGLMGPVVVYRDP